MIAVALRDGSFPGQRSATLADQAADEGPRLMRWERIGPGEGAGRTVVFTDMCLTEAANSPAARRIAWLLEPPSINPASYAYVLARRHVFDVVLTHQDDVAQQVDGLWYAFGGSRMPRARRVFEPDKRANVCMIVSHKATAPGHKLRHEVARRFGDQVDVYGDGYGPAVHHADVLPAYRYAIVIENDWSGDL